MNDFSKVYTVEQIKKMTITTVISLPMEENIMVPVSQAIDFMKRGENIIYFTFQHDSVKISNFFKEALLKEKDVDSFGKLAIIDAFQILEGETWDEFIHKTIKKVKLDCELNIIFLDIQDYVCNDLSSDLLKGEFSVLMNTPSNSKVKISREMTQRVKEIIFEEEVSAIFVTTCQKKSTEDTEITFNDFKYSCDLVNKSDFIMSINRVNDGFCKKIIKKILNFLLFWRKKNNFTLNVLKNRIGSDGHSHRMNIDLDDFKVEVL